MSTAPGYSEEGDQVVLRMTRDDWNQLLIALGYSAGSSTPRFRGSVLGLVNRLNQNNPNYTPYEVGEEAAQAK